MFQSEELRRQEMSPRLPDASAQFVRSIFSVLLLQLGTEIRRFQVMSSLRPARLPPTTGGSRAVVGSYLSPFMFLFPLSSPDFWRAPAVTHVTILVIVPLLNTVSVFSDRDRGA